MSPKTPAHRRGLLHPEAQVSAQDSADVKTKKAPRRVRQPENASDLPVEPTESQNSTSAVNGLPIRYTSHSILDLVPSSAFDKIKKAKLEQRQTAMETNQWNGKSKVKGKNLETTQSSEPSIQQQDSTGHTKSYAQALAGGPASTRKTPDEIEGEATGGYVVIDKSEVAEKLEGSRKWFKFWYWV